MGTAFLTPKAAEFLICFSSGRESIKWWTTSQAWLWALYTLCTWPQMLPATLSIFNAWISHGPLTARTREFCTEMRRQSVLSSPEPVCGFRAFFLAPEGAVTEFCAFFQDAFRSTLTEVLKFLVSTILLKFIFKKLKSRTSYLTCSNSNIFSKVTARWIEYFVYLSAESDKIDFVLGRCLVCNVKCSLKDVYVFSACKVLQSFWWWR